MICPNQFEGKVMPRMSSKDKAEFRKSMQAAGVN